MVAGLQKDGVEKGDVRSAQHELDRLTVVISHFDQRIAVRPLAFDWWCRGALETVGLTGTGFRMDFGYLCQGILIRKALTRIDRAYREPLRF